MHVYAGIYVCIYVHRFARICVCMYNVFMYVWGAFIEVCTDKICCLGWGVSSFKEVRLFGHKRFFKDIYSICMEEKLSKKTNFTFVFAVHKFSFYRSEFWALRL